MVLNAGQVGDAGQLNAALPIFAKYKVNKIITLAAIGISAIFLLAVPATAYYGDFPVATSTNGTINGSAYLGCVGPYGPCLYVDGTFDVPDGTIKWARLYTGVWGGTDTHTGWVNVTFNGDSTNCGLGPIHLEGVDDANPNVWCTGCGKYWIYYDVADLVNAGSANTFSSAYINGSIDGPAYGTILVVVLEGGDDPKNITYWVNDGSDYAPCTTYFNGSMSLGFAADANLTMVHLTAFEPPCADCLTFNGHTLDTSMITSNQLDINTWNVFDYLASSENNAWSNNGEDDYVSITHAILVIEHGEDETPPYTADHDPAPDATWIPVDTDIIVHVRDDGAGVDENTLVLTVEGEDVTGNTSITGTKTDYTLTYDPLIYFEYEQVVNVTVSASDLTSNTMQTDAYSFTIKGIDDWQPYTTDHDPAPDETAVLVNTNITVHIRDDHDGVNQSTIEMTVNSADVTDSLIITGTPADYTVIYDPPADFEYEQVVNVTISASDLNTTPNAMQYAYSFTTEAFGPDLIISMIDAYHNTTYFPDPNIPPYFNLSNEVDVEVKNTGSVAASPSRVSLYAGDEFIGKMDVPAIGAKSNVTVQFKWIPVGCDCEDDCNPVTYTLKAVADCDNDTAELNETNNESTVQETVYWAGYSADESLVTVMNGTIRGSLLYTTGDGVYSRLYNHGDTAAVHYDINMPSGAAVVLARLNVYYTWSMYDYPLMEVYITNQTGTYTVPLTANYNDRPCDNPAISYDYPFGNYVYDLTPYISESGSCTVTVKNNGNETNKSNFCISAPGIAILYQDDTKPMYKYWILEGADVLQGGRREGSGNLALNECINNAAFEGSIDINRVAGASLGLATPWGGAAMGEYHSYLYFNGDEIGKDVYHGYGLPYSQTLGGISMYVGGSNAQMGVNVSDVFCYLNVSDNVAGQGDDGDSMMAASAFLFVEYEIKAPSPFLVYGWVFHGNGSECIDPAVNITNLNTGEEWQAETDPDYNYYQILTSTHNVSTGDVLRICDICSGSAAAFNHTVTSVEMNEGGFEQNIINAGDLIITEILKFPDNCTICYSIMNTGQAVIPAGHNTTLYIDGSEAASDEVPVDLALDACYEGCFDGYDWTQPEANITVCADSFDTVIEIDEFNNCLTEIGICGDVDGRDGVTIGDGIQVAMSIVYGTDKYPLDNPWAADVDCKDGITIGDGIQIAMSIVYGTDKYPLECC